MGLRQPFVTAVAGEGLVIKVVASRRIATRVIFFIAANESVFVTAQALSIACGMTVTDVWLESAGTLTNHLQPMDKS